VYQEASSGLDTTARSVESGPAWVGVIRELVAQDGGISNLFVGLGSRSIFFFLVIGLQFFLYDYVKGLFQVSSDDLTLVLDVFYAVRAGLVGLVET
jgi:Mitochondrial carrier protein